MKLTQEQKDANKKARHEARETAKNTARIESEKNQKPIKEITISIEWRKSRMWGSNPHADARIEHKDGTWTSESASCSGCGYDKTSTVIADIFNKTLRYKLWQFTPETIKGGHGSLDSGPAPYGINSYSTEHRGFAGGIGESCYRAISEYIGGTWEHVASGKTFDVYKYTDKQ